MDTSIRTICHQVPILKQYYLSNISINLAQSEKKVIRVKSRSDTTIACMDGYLMILLGQTLFLLV